MQVIKGKTTTDIVIGVTANKQKRTFTIRKYYPNGKPYIKVRTNPLPKDRFNIKIGNTLDEWDLYTKRNTNELNKIH